MIHGDSKSEQVLGAILAGGASRRFGSPKASAELGGVALLVRVGQALGAAGAAPLVVGGDPELAGGAGYPWTPDCVGGSGPLRGLVTALRFARSAYAPGIICVACDMPFLAPALLRRLVDVARSSEAPAVAPTSTRNPSGEPLCAWYSIRCLEEAEARLASGDVRMRGLLAALDPIILSVGEVRPFGPDERLFLNVNTTADLQSAQSYSPIASSGRRAD